LWIDGGAAAAEIYIGNISGVATIGVGGGGMTFGSTSWPISFQVGGAYPLQLAASGTLIEFADNVVLGWSPDAYYNSAVDTGLSRIAAGSLAIGNGTQGDASGKLTLAQLILSATQSPASNAAGTAGELAYDANYIYVCIASGTWKRSPLTGGY
jgi:hypothetical protein